MGDFESTVHAGSEDPFSVSFVVDAKGQRTALFQDGNLNLIPPEGGITIELKVEGRYHEIRFEDLQVFSNDSQVAYRIRDLPTRSELANALGTSLPVYAKILSVCRSEFMDEDALLSVCVDYVEKMRLVEGSARGFASLGRHYRYEDGLIQPFPNWVGDQVENLAPKTETYFSSFPEFVQPYLVPGLSSWELAPAVTGYSEDLEQQHYDGRRATLEETASALADPDLQPYHEDIERHVVRILIGHLAMIVWRRFESIERSTKQDLLLPSLKQAFPPVVRIPPVRQDPRRTFTLAELSEYVLQGSIVSEPLRVSHVQSMLEEVNTAFKRISIPYEIILDRLRSEQSSSEVYSLLVRDARSGVKSNLVDAGHGLSQLLPVVLHYKSSITIIEQPELHLHPEPQVELAQLLCTKRYSSMQTLVETHSEHVVRGFQVEVAKGSIKADDVVVYYVDKRKNGNSFVQRFDLDKFGFFQKPWPEGFFDSGYRQVIEILTATRTDL
ncbi:AAA family ATPase [Bacteroidota bacterium]